jgi:hypothetical protein
MSADNPTSDTDVTKIDSAILFNSFGFFSCSIIQQKKY